VSTDLWRLGKEEREEQASPETIYCIRYQDAEGPLESTDASGKAGQDDEAFGRFAPTEGAVARYWSWSSKVSQKEKCWASGWSCCWPRACAWRTTPARYAARTLSGHGRYGAAKGDQLPDRCQAFACDDQGSQPPGDQAWPQAVCAADHRLTTRLAGGHHRENYSA
jgi:hypothetical protein